MIVTITQEVMERYCPFTRDVKGSKIFSSYADALYMADNRILVELLGQSLYSYLQTAIASHQYGNIEETMKRYICNEAAWRSAGKRDLVQTLHGFGTVSGQQELVASTARVNAMKIECRNEAVKAWDDLVVAIDSSAWDDKIVKASHTKEVEITDEEGVVGTETVPDPQESEFWKKLMDSYQWMAYTNHVVYLNSKMDAVVNTLQDSDIDEADKLKKYAWHINSVESKIRLLIGRDTMMTVLKHRREHTLKNEEEDVLELMTEWIATSINKEGNPFEDVKRIKGNLLYTLDNNIDVFSEFADSITYKGMHASVYESKKDDASFWF